MTLSYQREFRKEKEILGNLGISGALILGGILLSQLPVYAGSQYWYEWELGRKQAGASDDEIRRAKEDFDRAIRKFKQIKKDMDRRHRIREERWQQEEIERQKRANALKDAEIKRLRRTLDDLIIGLKDARRQLKQLKDDVRHKLSPKCGREI